MMWPIAQQVQTEGRISFGSRAGLVDGYLSTYSLLLFARGRAATGAPCLFGLSGWHELLVGWFFAFYRRCDFRSLDSHHERQCNAPFFHCWPKPYLWIVRKADVIFGGASLCLGQH